MVGIGGGGYFSPELREQLLCCVQLCRGDLSLDRSLKETLPPIKNDQCPVNRFDAYFQVVSAKTQELIGAAFALRYQVYCIERQFEDPSMQVGGLETDDHDRHAVHSLIFYRPRAEAIGTARLILPQARPNSLPIQQLLKKNGLN